MEEDVFFRFAISVFLWGVLKEPALEFDTDCVRMLEEMYEDQEHQLWRYNAQLYICIMGYLYFLSVGHGPFSLNWYINFFVQ